MPHLLEDLMIGPPACLYRLSLCCWDIFLACDFRFMWEHLIRAGCEVL